MIIEKTSLEPKFNKIQNAYPGRILKFKANGKLYVVDPYSEGLLAQYKITVPDDYIVTCVPLPTSSYSIKDLDETKRTYFFNVPALNITYTFSIGRPNTTPQVIEWVPTEYKQYSYTYTS